MRIKQSYPEIYRGTRGRGFRVSFDFYGSLFAESTIGRCESVICISKLRCAQNYTEPINDTARIACEDLTQSVTGTATIMDISSMRYRRQPYVTVMSQHISVVLTVEPTSTRYST